MTEYATIYVDPPWPEPGGCGRGTGNQYDTMKPSDILRVMVQAPCWTPAKNSHLWMSSTTTSLVDSLWLMKALGYEYKTHAFWLKSDGKLDLAGDLNMTIGMGQYLRIVAEPLLLGVRGKGMAVRTEALNIKNVIIAPVPRENGKRIHSAKPDAMYDFIRARSMGPRLEMFSRKRREGFDGWGNEYPAEETR